MTNSVLLPLNPLCCLLIKAIIAHNLVLLQPLRDIPPCPLQPPQHTLLALTNTSINNKPPPEIESKSGATTLAHSLSSVSVLTSPSSFLSLSPLLHLCPVWSSTSKQLSPLVERSSSRHRPPLYAVYRSRSRQSRHRPERACRRFPTQQSPSMLEPSQSRRAHSIRSPDLWAQTRRGRKASMERSLARCIFADLVIGLISLLGAVVCCRKEGRTVYLRVLTKSGIFVHLLIGLISVEQMRSTTFAYWNREGGDVVMLPMLYSARSLYRVAATIPHLHGLVF
ncbi:uncharacterized protein BJX67DRAFT_343330 [Aspergillus lucknowensis]|uniref:Uncharacterized protein n=1 Tax=Aspergillus lucknowensis TaxID=176173 RepID=A0ABR4M344_9EURO